MSPAPGAEMFTNYHEGYPAVEILWREKRPANFHGKRRSTFQAHMCEALHNGVTRADVEAVFGRPECTPALAPWDVKEMLMKECHMRQFAERNG